MADTATKTKIVVTGGTGVLGRPTVRSLVARGHEVRALVHSAQGERTIRELGATPVHGDLFDKASVGAAVGDAEAILHLATRIPSSKDASKGSAWEENDRIRTEGTRNLVEAALSGGVRTLIYPSVVLVYPDSGDAWIDASTADPAPIAFVRSTLDSEREVRRFAEAGRRGFTLRMGMFYAPEAGHTQDILSFARKGIAAVLGPGDAYLSSIWVDDGAAAVVAALENDRAPSGTYDVVDDEPLTRAELARAIAGAVGKQRLRRIPGFLAPLMLGRDLVAVNSRSQRVSNRRFKETTGWTPRVASARDGWARLRLSPHPGARDEHGEKAPRPAAA